MAFTSLLLLDPALGPAFTPEALAAFGTPVQIVVADPGDLIPPAAHGRYLAAHLQGPDVVAVHGGHLAFLDTCSLQINVMGIPLCTDAPGVDRFAVHEELARLALRFFS